MTFDTVTFFLPSETPLEPTILKSFADYVEDILADRMFRHQKKLTRRARMIRQNRAKR